MNQFRFLLGQLFGALILMVPIYQAWGYSPLETWMSDGHPGWDLMEVWFLILNGIGCVGAWMYVVGTMTGVSYLLGLIGMRALLVQWRKWRGKTAKTSASELTARVARWAAIAVVSLPIYVVIANLLLRDTRVAQFVFWLRSPGQPMLPVPGGFGCLSHSHWVFYAIYAVSTLIAWWIVRSIERRCSTRRYEVFAP